MPRARGGRYKPYLKTCVYAFLAPGSGATVESTSWKNTTTGTYNGTAGNPTQGLSSGTVGSPGSGGWILGGNAAAYQDALRRRGHNVDPADANGLWRTGGTKGTLTGGQALNAVWIYGEALVDFLSMFDLVFLGDLPPEELLQDIKKRSRRPGGTKIIIGFFNFESVNQRLESNDLMEPIRARIKTRLLQSNTASSVHGPSTYCNQFEVAVTNANGSTSNANPPADVSANTHSWMSRPLIDTLTDPDTLGASDLSFLAALGTDISTVLSGRYAAGTVDGIIWDNVLDQAYFGVATNRPATIGNPSGGSGSDSHAAFVAWCNSAKYRNAWKQFLRYIQGKIPGQAGTAQTRRFGIIFGNTGGSVGDFSIYDAHDLPGRFVEYFFHASAASPTGNTVTSMRQQLATLRGRNVAVIAGLLIPSNSTTTEIYSWATTDGPEKHVAGAGGKGTWSKLLDLVQSADMHDKFYVLAARTSSGGVLLYHPTFGPIG